MIRMVFFSVLFFSSFARALPGSVVQNLVEQVITTKDEPTVHLSVGDWTLHDYAITRGNETDTGSMRTEVEKETEDGYWLKSDVNIGGVAMDVQLLLSKTDRRILRYFINGKEKQHAENKVVEKKENVQVTVDAGTFNSTHSRYEGQGGVKGEKWQNFEVVPVTGLIKEDNKNRFFRTVIELKEFYKQ